MYTRTDSFQLLVTLEIRFLLAKKENIGYNDSKNQLIKVIKG